MQNSVWCLLLQVNGYIGKYGTTKYLAFFHSNEKQKKMLIALSISQC